MRQLFIFLLVFLFIDTRAQLFDNIELYPNVNQITGKYFNGSGGRGYWTLQKVDSIGRIYVTENHFKNKLMSRERIEYDFENNKTAIIQDYDINNPGRIDTFSYKYRYLQHRITYQNCSIYKNDSTEFFLIDNIGDSIYVYKEISYSISPGKGKINRYQRKHYLTYRNGTLIKIERIEEYNILNIDIQGGDNSKEITLFEYYPNRRLKRKTIIREPQPTDEPIYVGGPGGDDIFYKYKLDRRGRITRYYEIIKGHKFKLATYRYIKK